MGSIFCYYSNAMKMRKEYKDLFLKKHNLKLGFMSPFLKASSVALEQMPTVNAGKYSFSYDKVSVIF